ncbi:MAG: 3-hydroxyacyl-CoA dehydrogenase family protein [Gemmatimonadota bacterium]|nr:3-hydroxyacyl-CoA dehydrogenase family protein [Gemmatimonadota bacterium]MDE2984172.1 3-hydroxyacyl-CoA dehydrogenase family protein [Gemmatimonadota bacterium]
MADHGIGRVAVIGAGTMGHGIAQAAAMAGHDTVLCDVDAAQVERALARIEATMDKGVRLGKVAETARDGALARLAGTGGLREAVEGADLVIEAVPEVMALKKRVFAEVEAAAGTRTILATNTSSLSVTGIAAGLAAPGRFLGLHFFNPVHIMALVEIVRGDHTTIRTLNTALKFVAGLGKEPIVVTDSPGFASSRLGIVLGLEAIRMVEAGVASPEDIDKAMVLGYRHPMGPLRLTDLVGLDVRLEIARHLHESLDSEAFRPPALLERMVAGGRLGKKTGRGFYKWDDGP